MYASQREEVYYYTGNPEKLKPMVFDLYRYRNNYCLDSTAESIDLI